MRNKKVMVVVHESTKLALDTAKKVDCETYNSVINRALKSLAQAEKKD
jgi:hypothetical protein